MSTVWIVAADSSRAKILESPNRVGPLTAVQDLEHPESRLKNRDLSADGPGRSFDSAGQGRHAMEPETEAREVEAARFARQISRLLREQSDHGRFDRLVLAAPPEFLGLLRDSLDKPVRDKISAEVIKDIATESPDDIRKHLPDFLY